MLYYALVFLLVAILAAVFGFYNLAGKEEIIGKVLFVLFIVLFLASLVTRRSPPA